jgi:hypothetical protein
MLSVSQGSFSLPDAQRAAGRCFRFWGANSRGGPLWREVSEDRHSSQEGAPRVVRGLQLGPFMGVEGVGSVH